MSSTAYFVRLHLSHFISKLWNKIVKGATEEIVLSWNQGEY